MLLNKKSNIIAFGGIATALSLVCLFVTGVFQFSKFFFCFCSSLICGVMVVAFGCKTALVHYVAVCALALMFVPDKPVAVLYLVVFGNYPVIRFFVDGIKRPVVKTIIKLFVFSIYLAVLLLITKYVLNIDITATFRYSIWILWLFMICLLYLYDFIYMPFVRRVYSILNKI